MQIEMFDCTRRNMRLTKAGCARLYIGANDSPAPQPWEGRAACVSCSMGAKHAGRDVPVMSEAIQAIKRCCPRCLNLAPRLINGRYCISCYNRHCEALRGRNARGGRPRLCDQLHNQAIGVSHGAIVSRRVEPAVVSMVEAILVMACKATSAMAFGSPKVLAWADRAIPQQELAF